jgi:sulfopyruvate decarboxylase TPP-binding subunit
MVEAVDAGWKDQLYDSIKALKISQVVYVPDAGHAKLIDRCLADPELDCFPLVNEFESVGVCVGGWLGGRRSCVLMQSSGIGNAINALGLVHSTGAPFFAIATMRGEWGEFNGWQTPMGQSIPRMLEAANIVVNRAETPADVIPVTEASGRLAFNSYLPVFTLISQRATGAKVF